MSDATISLNEGRERIRLQVTNRGDRPIQVGSHYHFALTNPLLSFDRLAALGFRLDIPAGTAVRFEPGDRKTVTLVSIGGGKIVTGGNGLPEGVASWTVGDVDSATKIVETMLQKGFGHVASSSIEKLPAGTGGFQMSRESYASMFGPTVGDKVRLGDTPLWIEVEHDFTVYGDELKFGGGKVVREGMGQSTNRSDAETLDIVITNALIVDWSGIYKVNPPL